MKTILLAVLALPASLFAAPKDVPDPYGILRKPVPDKTVVLTFDDGVASHATNVAPLLKKLGFGGSFYICDFARRFTTPARRWSRASPRRERSSISPGRRVM